MATREEINAIIQQNAANARLKEAAEARATAALEKGRPIINQALSGVSQLNQAIQAQIAAAGNPQGIYNPLSGTFKSYDQLQKEATTAAAAATGSNRLGGLTTEQIELSKQYGKEREDALKEAASYGFIPVPTLTDKTVVNTYTDPETGDIYALYSDGSRVKIASGQSKAQTERQSAYDVLYQQFAQYGLQSLVEPLKELITSSVSPSEFAIRLRQTEPYRQRFAANQLRINKGLKALSEGDYLGLEDKYQTLMRNYGLPASYYLKGDLGRQEGFEKLIANDVSAAELEDRIILAQDRVLKAAPEITAALKKFYPDITNGDILAYTLDPDKALSDIKKKVTIAEIAGTATKYGLTTSEIDAEYLQRYGITKEKAEQGYATVTDILGRGRQLGDFYKSPYTQEMAEVEAFGLPSYEESKRQRKRLVALEQASFAGQSGLTSGALSRERAGQY